MLLTLSVRLKPDATESVVSGSGGPFSPVASGFSRTPHADPPDTGGRNATSSPSSSVAVSRVYSSFTAQEMAAA